MKKSGPYSLCVNWGRSLSLVLVMALLLSLIPAAQAGNNEPPRAHPSLLKMARDHPNDKIRVIVQKDMRQKNAPGDEPEQALEKTGGKVKKRLDLINGFSAELAAKDLEKLAKHNKLLWVSFDAPLFSTALVTSTVMDTFTTGAFDGNSGTQDWSGAWQELGEADGPGAGAVKVMDATSCATSTCLQIGGSWQSIAGRGVMRQVDLSHATSAVLSFSYRRGNTTGTMGSVSAQVSGNGGASWTTLGTYNLNTNDANQVVAIYNIAPFIASNTQIRFLGSGTANRNLFIDNVQIEYAMPTNLPAPPGFLTVRDEFMAVTYSGNSGTQNWSTDWIESDAKGGGGTSGNVRVVLNSSGCASGAGNCLYVSNYDAGDSVYRSANLSGATSATLTLFRNNLLAGLNSNDSIVLEASKDGTAWTTLRTWQDINDDIGAAYESFDLTPYISSATRIRFRVASRADNGYMLFDNIQIQSTRLLNVYDRAIGADRLWAEPPYLDGQGITVAVVDSGITNQPDLQVSGGGASRIIASTSLLNTSKSFINTALDTSDGYGHGTHMAGIIGGNGARSSGARMGVAPGVNLINVKVANDNGMSYSSDLVEGLQWIYDNHAAYNIRVVNISMNSAIAESYRTNAVDAAAEILWFNGVVVVVSAGNNGSASGPVTLYPPANDPFVITVGATDDQGTVGLNDDVVPSFSAYGTTSDGFAKPDLVAPGRNIISLLASTSATMYDAHPANRVDTTLFRMSGTSASAPMVSGAVALLLQDEPGLNPGQVKYRLKATARATGWGYNASKAGAGYLDAYAAVHGTTAASANTGIAASQLLATGSSPINWGSVDWNSVDWNSVDWNSVDWNSVDWNSDYWGP